MAFRATVSGKLARDMSSAQVSESAVKEPQVTGANYDAFWIPGLNADVDPDDALELGYAWLRQAERKHAGVGVLVMHASSMRGNRPVLARAPWDIVSPRTRRPRGSGPALAVWPSSRALELAEALAFGTALCVIPGSLFDVGPWIRRAGAVCLAEGFDTESAIQLPADIREALDHALFFGGHNGFLGGGEKEYTIRTLREFAGRADAPTAEAIEEYLAGSGETNAKGAARAARWYQEIREGKRHLDYARRPI